MYIDKTLDLKDGKLKLLPSLGFLSFLRLSIRRIEGLIFFEVKLSMAKNTTKEEYLDLLRAVAEREKRLPKKSDFEPLDVNRIKSFFGPWPWALEEAGLKESKKEKRQQKNRVKRERSKQRRKQFKSDDS